MKGKVADASDRWAIDATVFENNSHLYMVWSGWEGEVNGAQNLYLAELADPTTIKGRRVRISAPEYPWERIGDLKPREASEINPGADPTKPLHVDVNEGPEILRHGDRIFLVYSAGGCWTDYYSLAMLTASASSDLMDAASWKKTLRPVLALPAGTRICSRPQQLLPVPGRQRRLDPLPRQFRARAWMRRPRVRRERSVSHGRRTVPLTSAGRRLWGFRSPPLPAKTELA